MVGLYIGIGVVAVLYIAVCVYFFFNQEEYIFHPLPLDEAYNYDLPDPFTELFLNPHEGTTINALYFKHEDRKSKGIILYHHGNADNLAYWAPFYKPLYDLGYDVLMYDYPGYGKSKGKLCEYSMHRVAHYIYNRLRKEYAPEEIIQYGVSLGSGVACRLASVEPAPLLILETPYYSLLSMARLKFPWLPVSAILKYKFLSYKYIKEVSCEKYIVHGTQDELIPFKQGLKLLRSSKSAHLITIEGAGHSNLHEFPQYHAQIAKVLA